MLGWGFGLDSPIIRAWHRTLYFNGTGIELCWLAPRKGGFLTGKLVVIHYMKFLSIHDTLISMITVLPPVAKRLHGLYIVRHS